VRYGLFLCCAALAWGQGTTPKSKIEDYEVHAAGIGAEFMVHSLLTQDQSMVVKDYLLLEVALYPPKRELVRSDPAAFALRINGKTVPHATPQMVGLGMRDLLTVRQSQPPPTGRWPVPRSPVPMPQPPTQEDRAGIDRPERVPPHELVVRAALPEGSFDGPVSGYLYFPYKGKTASIQSLDLIYNDTVLKLR
jgi:hypothetical protein